MHNTARNAAAFVFVLSVLVTPLLLSSRPSHVDIAGHVYERDSTGKSNMTPVAGAVVSNDWDSTTATTNAKGEFRLRVRRVAADEFIKFTARSGERTACHRRIGPIANSVEIVLNDPDHQVGGCM